METSNSDLPKPKGEKPIGATAARLRKRLESFDESRRRTQERLRKERDDLAKDVAETERREHRRMRNRELNDQKRIKLILGGLALGALRRCGAKDFALTAADIDGLSPKDRELIEEVLRAVRQTSGQPATGTASGVDISIE